MNEHPTRDDAFFNSSAVHTLELLSDADFWNYARQQASIIPDAAHTEEYLECTLGNFHCLVPLTTLFEVVPPPHQLALLPDIPDWMSGVIAWRGEIIAVVELATFLSTEIAGTSTERILLVARDADATIGLLVPAIGQTISLQPEMVQKPQKDSALKALSQTSIVQGIYQDAFLLDIPALFTEVMQQIGNGYF